MSEQLTLFDTLWETYKIKKPIRLIELFAGYGSQHLALKYLGANFESHRIAEWAVKSIQAYKDLHCPEDHTNYSAALSRDEVVDFLLQKGVSMDYNQPMTREQLMNLKEQEVRTIYNNIIATNNLVSVCNAKGSDFDIVDQDKYEYIMTYSFPCQDLSLCGKVAGMKKGSGTRSGLLWEVERILNELKAENKLPQILLMENVVQVHGEKNWADFEAWKKSLATLGYCNFWKDLEATDYGVPQTRDRTFMVSILGDYNYNFPQPKPLTTMLDNIVETNLTDRSYYLTEKQIESMQMWKAQQDPFKDIDKPKHVSPTITARGAGEYHSGMILINESLIEKDVQVVGGIGEMKSNNGKQFFFQDRIYKDNVAVALSATFNPYYLVECGVRKLTERESFRLMGVKDADFDLIARNQTRRSLYHLAGDSIVVDVLMAIFKELL